MMEYKIVVSTTRYIKVRASSKDVALGVALEAENDKWTNEGPPQMTVVINNPQSDDDYYDGQIVP